MEMDRIEELILKTIDDHRGEIIDFGRDIYTHAELGYKEYRTSTRFNEKMESLGLRVEKGLAITGSKAYLNEDKKDGISIALIGELDALRIPDHEFSNPETGAAHCCGHHIQLTGVFGAAVALTVPEVARALGGQVIFFAVPSEEYGEVEFKNGLIKEGKLRYAGGKCELIRTGAFDNIDLCIAHHTEPGRSILIGNGTGNGFVSKVIRYKGRGSHAAAAPDRGVNALSAASLGLQALGLNRETFRDEDSVRVHPIITRGGNLVNIIPDDVVLETLVRGKTLDAIAGASKKTDRSFKAGALAMGAEVVIETAPGYLPVLPVEPIPELRRAAQMSDPDASIVDYNTHTSGSTDVGDVQHLMPVFTFRTGGVTGGLHETDFRVADEDASYIATAKIFALTAYSLLKDKAARSHEIVDNYRPVFKNKEEYVAFMEQFNSIEDFDCMNH